MSTLTQKLEQHMQGMEDVEVNISTCSSTKLLMSYYGSLGLTQDTSIADWMYGISTGKYPAYSSITRAIRKARGNNTSWMKTRKTVDSQVKSIEQEVGYADR